MDGTWAQLGIQCTEPVRDPLWKNILLPENFMPVVNSVQFVQLSRVLQLGPAHLVYPGATHTRAAHSLGVYEMARRILGTLLDRGALDIVSPAGARAFLMAALCHDLGHFPYAHSLKELPLTEHEALTGHILQGPLAPLLLAAGVDPALCAAIVDEDMPLPNQETALYRSLLSGVLDPDKLDYLNRDAWACGVPYGLQDVDFVLQHIGLDGTRPGMDERGAMAVEGVLFSKYRMYKAVYWHRSVRSATAMMKKALIHALVDGSLKPEELYGLDDYSFYALMGDPARDSLGLVRAVHNGQLAKTALETPYMPDNPRMARASALEARSALEDELADSMAQAGKSRPIVVIDIPEPISFESDLPILGTGQSFSTWAAVFRPETVASFTHSLRVLRVFTNLDPAYAKPRVEEFFGLRSSPK